jgi:putative ATP-binding cassette transporter
MDDRAPNDGGPLGTLAESLRLARPFWPLAVFATVAGGVSGLATAALLATINRALHADGDALVGLLMAFAGLGVVSIAGELVGNIGNSLVGQRITVLLRKELTSKILSAPIAEIERYKAYRLIAILAQDVNTIALIAFNFSTIAIAFAIAVGCFGYLAFLSPPMFGLALVATAFVVAAQAAASRIGRKGFDAVRDAHDDLQKHYRAIIDGAKEIRINRERRARVQEGLTRTIEKIGSEFVRTTRVFFAARSFSAGLFYVTLLLVLVLGMRLAADKAVVSGFVLVLLYVKGPVEQVVTALPLFSEAQASFRKVADASAAFATAEPCLSGGIRSAAKFDGKPIELRNARYEFPALDGGAPFVLGPVDLSIDRGETVFIVGKNGTGKTTLIKLLLGLYAPMQGELRCDGKPIEPNELDDYRQLFSTIFFDYFLFEDLIAARTPIPEDVDRYLRMLEIAHKVAIRDGQFSTTDLSTGQRKRLALIHVFLEQRPIVVLDEWAADQDPAFRQVFYERLLPDMKRQGKTLIVVSHDDRYFDTADRLIRMEAGSIVEDRRLRDRRQERLQETSPRQLRDNSKASPRLPAARAPV